MKGDEDGDDVSDEPKVTDDTKKIQLKAKQTTDDKPCAC